MIWWLYFYVEVVWINLDWCVMLNEDSSYEGLFEVFEVVLYIFKN